MAFKQGAVQEEGTFGKSQIHKVKCKCGEHGSMHVDESGEMLPGARRGMEQLLSSGFMA